MAGARITITLSQPPPAIPGGAAARPEQSFRPGAGGTSREQVDAMTGPPMSLISWPVPAGDAPEAGPARADQLAWPCTRCGAAGTHYLTCPSLRLPAGYRLSQDLGPDRADGHSERPGTGQASRVSGPYRDGQPGGPDHPDWPSPPRH
jgi:hypothetical protein